MIQDKLDRAYERKIQVMADQVEQARDSIGRVGLNQQRKNSQERAQGQRIIEEIARSSRQRRRIDTSSSVKSRSEPASTTTECFSFARDATRRKKRRRNVSRKPSFRSTLALRSDKKRCCNRSRRRPRPTT